MELNERQQRVLRGEICPYCGKETELMPIKYITEKD